MNFEYKIQLAIKEAEQALENANMLKISFNNAKDFTGKFLDKCAKEGITKISIGKKTKKVPITMRWPFCHEGSVFSFTPENNKTTNTWPAIWGVVDSFGIGGGCGNPSQKQLSLDGKNKLIDGVYELRKGKWKKTE